MFFLVSGASASGKTTLIRHLAGTDNLLEVHDQDEWAIDNEGTRCAHLENGFNWPWTVSRVNS